MASELSHDRVADYKPFTCIDGEGVRCALYVSGCRFNCVGCFNKEIQAFDRGEPYSTALEETIISDLRNPYVQGLTLLGGEPFLNTAVCLPLVRRVRHEFGTTKDIWAWSGYTFEGLQQGSADKQELLAQLDVLVDGQFRQEEYVLNLRFRGSLNQRILAVKESLAAGGSCVLGRVRKSSCLVNRHGDFFYGKKRIQ